MELLQYVMAPKKGNFPPILKFIKVKFAEVHEELLDNFSVELDKMEKSEEKIHEKRCTKHANDTSTEFG